MIPLVTEHRSEIAALCERYGVEVLEVFGSAASGDFNPSTSDIDFIARFADMSPGVANRYLDFAEALEALLGRSVDVMVDGPITNPYLRHRVDMTRESVVAREDRQAAVRRASRGDAA